MVFHVNLEDCTFYYSDSDTVDGSEQREHLFCDFPIEVGHQFTATQKNYK